MSDNSIKAQYYQQEFTSGNGIFGPFDITTKLSATIEADFSAGSGSVWIKATNLPPTTNVQELKGRLISTLTNVAGQPMQSDGVLAAGECYRMCFAVVSVVQGSVALRFLCQPGSI